MLVRPEPSPNEPAEPEQSAKDPLGIISDARRRAESTLELASRHLDTSWVEVLRIIGFDESYVSAKGSYLHDTAGRAYLDMHTGEGFASLGHNHPDVRAALSEALASDLVDGVQIHYSVLAGMLAQELTSRLPDGLDAVYFTSAGAEAVDAAMKFARAATGRPRLVSCQSGFHGVTLGPLALVGDDFFKEGFGPMLPGCAQVPYGDLDRLEAELRRGDVAAFIVEPIQGRQVSIPPAGYLGAAQELCRRYGTLFILDEIQTGLGRIGRWFALEHEQLAPDFVLVGKALSGGYMPVAAMVARREIYQRAVGTLERSYVHQSTFGRNRLSMVAGLAALRILARDRLVERSEEIGAFMLGELTNLQERHAMISEVRGRGLMIGIELASPDTRMGRLNWRLIHLASEGLFPQLVVIPLNRDHGIITMASGKNDVIKLLPPLTISREEAAHFLEALDAVLTECETSPSQSWREVRAIAKNTLHRRQGADAARGISHAFRGGTIDISRGDVCLVTGASGFIGGHLVEHLVSRGIQVRALVRASSDTKLLERLGVQIATGDLTDPPSLTHAAEGCQYVFHCGAIVSDWATVEEMKRINVTGTRNVLEASIAAGVQRLIHFSSTDVYGHPGALSVTEAERPARFSNWYSQTKLQAEMAVRELQEGGGLETVILRPATIYGPRSVNVVGQIAKAIRARQMILIGGGHALAGLCYIDNLIDAALLAMNEEAAAGEIFNVSDGLAVTWRQFVEDLARGLGCGPARLSIPYPVAAGLGFSMEQGYRLLRRATGVQAPPLLSRQAVDVMGREQSFSNAKLREVVGWSPRVSYRSGLEATLEWLEAPSAGRSALAKPLTTSLSG